MLPEGPASADEVLPHPRLRFVNAQGNSLAQRHAETVRRQTLLVDAVARLVQDAEKGRVEESRVVPRGDAAVVRSERGTKGMGRHVEPSASEVKTDRRGRFLAKRLLHVDRVTATQQRRIRAAAACTNGGDQPNELLAEIGQHPSHVRRQFFRLEIVQQGVVGRLLIAQGLGLLTLEFERLGQPRLEVGEIVFPPGLLPGALAQDGSPGELLHEAARQLGLLVDQPLEPADGDGRFAVRLACQWTGGQFPHFGHECFVRPPLVDHTGKQRRLVGAVLGLGGGHHRSLVPFQDGADGGQERGLTDVLTDFVEQGGRRLGHGISRGVLVHRGVAQSGRNNDAISLPISQVLFNRPRSGKARCPARRWNSHAFAGPVWPADRRRPPFLAAGSVAQPGNRPRPTIKRAPPPRFQSEHMLMIAF